MAVTTIKKASPKPLPIKPVAQPIGVEDVPPKTPIAPPAQMEVKQGKATVNVEHTSHGAASSVTEEQVAVGEPMLGVGPYANVGVGFGMTRKVADYENVKFDVRVNIPCETDEGSLEMAYNFAKSWVEQRVAEINTEIDSQLNGGE